MSQIKFVYFDMGGVLLDFSQVFTALGKMTDVDPQELRQAHFHFDHDLCSGRIELENYWDMVKENLEIDVDLPKQLDEIFIDHFYPIDQTHDLAKQLQSDYGVGLLTNSWGRLVEMSLENNIIPDIDYDVIIDSHEELTHKPERSIYELATERALVPPESIFFIDDTEENVDAALELGWSGMVFDTNNPSQSVAEIKDLLGL